MWNGYRVSIWPDEKLVVGMEGGDGCGASWVLLNCIRKNGEDGKFYITCILPQFKHLGVHLECLEHS